MRDSRDAVAHSCTPTRRGGGSMSAATGVSGMLGGGGGVGGTASGALSSISSDLSVSVSFNIARELLDASNDEQLAEDELIGLVLGFSIVFTALQTRLRAEIASRKKASVERAKSSVALRFKAVLARQGYVPGSPNDDPAYDALLASMESDAVAAELARQAEARGLIDFLYLLVSICQRICVAISVQLLAASVRAQQPSRLVRTVSLIGLATFFVFVESLTHRTMQ